MRHERVDSARVRLHVREISEAEARLFRGGLGEEDDHLVGAPALEVEHESECDEVVDAERACEAPVLPVGETLSPSLFLMLDHLGEGQLNLHDGGVGHQRTRAHFVHCVVGPDLEVALGFDGLGLVLEEIVEYALVVVLGVDEAIRVEACALKGQICY